MDNDSVYRDLVDGQEDLLVKFSPEGRLLFVNSAYCEATGKKREELAGSIFLPAEAERYSDVMATQMTKLFRPPHTCTVEQWMQTPRGLRCISWSAKSILDSEGGVTSIVAAGRDITRMKQDQKGLRKKDEELTLVIESGREMYYTHTPDHTMLYVSPRIRALLGCSPRTGRRAWTDYLSDNPMNAAGLERTLRAVSTGRREPPYRLEFLGRNGARIWVEVNEIPVVKNGRTVAIAGSLVDVTEKRIVDEGLAEAELLLKGYGGTTPQTRPAPSAWRQQKKPAGFWKSLFSREEEEETDEGMFEVPENIL